MMGMRMRRKNEFDGKFIRFCAFLYSLNSHVRIGSLSLWGTLLAVIPAHLKYNRLANVPSRTLYGIQFSSS